MMNLSLTSKYCQIMKKALLLVSACLLHLVANAQNYAQNLNSLFPIQGTVTTGYPEFTAANVEMSYEYMGKKILLSDRVWLYKGTERYWGQTIQNIKYHSNKDLGSFISFNYSSNSVPNVSGPWNISSSTTQFAFHPGGMNWKNANYNNSEEPYYVPLYAFTYSDEEGLNLVDLQSGVVIATIGEGGDIRKYAYLSVLAGDSRNNKDVIIVAGKDTFSIYGVFVEDGENGVKVVVYSNSAPSYFDMNGRKMGSPKHGVNIVVDGETTKKVVVK